MFSLYLEDDALGTGISTRSRAWLGGYSRDFLRGFIDGDAAALSDEAIDSHIQWIQLPPGANKWETEIRRGSLLFGDEAVEF